MQIAPFRALRYAPAKGAIGPLIAPPYDVIPPGERRRLAAHPHNIVHLDLPEAPAGGDPYREAAERLRAWVRDGVLRRDPRPAFYILEQTYRIDGRERRRRGLFARLRLEPYDAGVVIPHERTLERPRADRESLLAATRTQLSPIFMLHPDDGGTVSRRLAEFARGEAAAETGGESAVRLVPIDDPGATAEIARLLGGAWALIADGHHRYESSLQYRDARRAAGAKDAEHVLAFLCSLEDPGLTILPIHRLVHSLPEFRPPAVRTALGAYFDLQPLTDRGALPAALAEGTRRPGMFGLAFQDGAFVARWKEGTGLDRPGMRGVPEALRRLDVILLHRLVLEEVLGIGLEAQSRQTNLDYVKDAPSLLERAAQAQLGVLLNPTPIDQVVAVSKAGLRLPQKTTYFYPKVPSGLVLDPLDEKAFDQA
jgi:uncharacterized protein (DUF1015 family)